MGTILGCGDPTAVVDGEVGSTSATVVGGWAATTDQIFATIEIRRTGASVGFCSGALIAPAVVATAAHCAVVEPEPGVVQPTAPGSLSVAAGHLQSDDVTEEMVRTVSRILVHESYDHEFIMGRSRAGAGQGGIGSPNDIALLFLDAPFHHVPVAPLLTPERERELLNHGDVGFVAGYGVSDVDEGTMGELYISDAIVDIIGTRELLTRRSDQLGDSCYGDSGGPLYIPTEEGDFLVGLVSRGRSDVKRDCGDGGVYTLLSAHLDWIEQAADGAFELLMDRSEMAVSFLEEGADPISIPKGGSLRRAGSCRVAPAEDHTAASALLALASLTWLVRRLSRI